MSKYLRVLGQGIKYSLYLGLATLSGSFLYLQYINAQLGGIDVNKEELIRFYTDNK